MAPEMFATVVMDGKSPYAIYSHTVDNYALGVTLFMM
jgi:hypothetical protein